MAISIFMIRCDHANLKELNYFSNNLHLSTNINYICIYHFKKCLAE